MATIAKAFAGHGYLAVAFDFWGHGRSRISFDWRSNPAQVHAWCTWARSAYPDLPLVYLGHSMGGFAGAETFSDGTAVDAFVSLGAIPRRFPEVPTLLAAGQFEELFTPEEAARRAEGHADLLISTWSNHVLEACDPILIYDIVAWVNNVIGLPRAGDPPWARWASGVSAIMLGCAAAFLLAGGVTALFAGAPGLSAQPQSARIWSLNPYRIAGHLLGSRGYGQAPRTSSFLRAASLAVLYSGVLVVVLSILLNRDVFTCHIVHPGRCVAWAITTLLFMPVFLIDAVALERLALRSTLQRLLIAALTRGVPLLVAGIAMRFVSPGMAFAGMLIAILAFVAVMLSLVHACATRSTGDYRTGALASSIMLAWVLMFWLPMTW
jgi:pimeloyl-ACP methyl ester carboxylesterase